MEVMQLTTQIKLHYRPAYNFKRCMGCNYLFTGVCDESYTTKDANWRSSRFRCTNKDVEE